MTDETCHSGYPRQLTQRNALAPVCAYGAVAEKYRQAVFSSDKYKSFEEQVLQRYRGQATIQKEKATTFKVDTNAIVVRIPIASKVEGVYSAIFKGESTTIESTITGLFLPAPDKSVHMIITRNERTVVDHIASPQTSTLPPGIVLPAGFVGAVLINA